MTCTMTLTLLHKVSMPYFHLYLVTQGHSFPLYYTVSCTGICFSSTTLQKSDSNSFSQRSGMTCYMTFPLLFKVSITSVISHNKFDQGGVILNYCLYISCCKST